MSSNEPSLGINSGSSLSSLHHPSELHPFLPSPNPLYNLPPFGGYSSSECLSVPLQQERYERLAGSRELNSILIGHEFFEDPTQTSTAFEDTQSVTKAGFSREQKPKNESQIPSHTNSYYSFSCYPDSENKSYNRPTDKKRENVIYIPEQLKDDKYWNRRQKNNLAVKKWRDAKRRHGDFIVQRVTFLEVENIRLRLELSCLREQNERLKRFLSQLYPTI